MPTAANLNLHRGWKSCVGWHCVDEPRLGECGDAKLIVSMSFGTSVVFRWRRRSCPDDEGHLCWLGHGDILVMDGQCQDEFFHRTHPGREQERINVTLRFVGTNNMFPPVLCLGQEWHAVCQRVRSVYQFLLWRTLGLAFFLAFGLLFGALCILGYGLCWFTPCGVQGLGHVGVHPAGHALWAQVGGGIIFVTLGESAWQLIYSHAFLFFLFFFFWGCFQVSEGTNAMLASVGQPSLHGHDACMVN